MWAFLVIAFVIFFLFSKFYTIAKKKDAINGNEAHSAFVFTVFMFICMGLWLAFKYAFKSTVLALVCLLLWPNIKKFVNELETDGRQDTKSSRSPNWTGE
jgi:spore maturation protein SpmA